MLLTLGRSSHPNRSGCLRRPRKCAWVASRWRCWRKKFWKVSALGYSFYKIMLCLWPFRIFRRWTMPSCLSCSSSPRPTTSSPPCKLCLSTRS